MERDLSGQVETRIEAFAELLRERGMIPRRLQYEAMSRAVGPILLKLEEW